MYRDNWRSKFIPKEIRPIQERALDSTADFLDKGHNVLSELGTGVGKSYIAHAIAATAPSAFIVTSDNQLVRQYEREFSDVRGFKSIKGRSNYNCTKFIGESCEDGMDRDDDDEEEDRKPCPRSKDIKIDDEVVQEATCPYVVSKRKAIESRIAFTNIAYYATGVRFDEAWDKRNITVFDEAHSLESALYNQIEIIIDRRILNLFKIAGIDFTINTIKSMKSEKNWSANNYWKSSQGRPVEFLDALDKLTKLSPVIVKKLNSWSEDKVFKKKRKALDKFYTTLQYILNKPDDNLWIIDVYEYTDTDLESYEHGFIKLSARPVFIRDFTQRLIFSQAKQFVFQSATIIDGKQFAYELGINNWKGMRYKTPFSKDNRRIYALDCGSLARESFKESLPKCINTLEDILDARLYQKGIVHTASYELQMTLKQKLKPSARYLFPRNSKENEEALRVHELSANTVLFSPSMTQGVDLRDGLARFCVIFKVPYPNLGDRRVFRKSKIDRGWYNYATAKTVIQATGRGVRSSEDWCDTFIIDSSFNKLYKNYSALDWYLGDAIELNPELARDAIYERRD